MLCIIRNQITNKPRSELWALHRALFNQLSQCKPCSHESNQTLASIENVQQEINTKLQHDEINRLKGGLTTSDQ